MNDYTYVGDALEIFKDARNWKNYYKSLLKPYLGSIVLEVGAGVGSTTQLLCDGTQKEWICLEPHNELIKKIQSLIEQLLFQPPNLLCFFYWACGERFPEGLLRRLARTIL